MDTKKILTIPDLHGKSSWKNVFDTNFDYIVFLGDYVDDFPPTTDGEILDNLIRVIEIKKMYPDKIILLWGNHEMSYLFPPSTYSCSGFRFSMFPVLHQLLNANRHLFQYSFQYKDHVWTHGGIHRGWWEYSFKSKDKFGNVENIAEQLNIAFNRKQPKEYDKQIESLFDCGWDRGGRARIGGPLWVDRSSLWEKGLSGIHQIVGHNKVPKIMSCKVRRNKKVTGSITFCDCLDVKEEYHIIEI